MVKKKIKKEKKKESYGMLILSVYHKELSVNDNQDRYNALRNALQGPTMSIGEYFEDKFSYALLTVLTDKNDLEKISKLMLGFNEIEMIYVDNEMRSSVIDTDSGHKTKLGNLIPVNGITGLGRFFEVYTSNNAKQYWTIVQ